MSLQRNSIALFIALGFSLSTVACSDAADDDGAGGEGGANGGSSSGGASSGSSSGGSSSGGSGGEGGGGSGVAEEWLGATPHASLLAEVSGQNVGIEPSADDAANLSVFYCERNYVVPDAANEATYGQGQLAKVEVKFNFFYQGVEAEFQIEIEQENLQDLEGETLTVGADLVAAVKLQPLGDGGEFEYEDAAVSGTVLLELLSGEPGADGLIVPNQTGAVGAYVNIQLESGGFLRGSFTANCGDNDDVETAE